MSKAIDMLNNELWDNDFEKFFDNVYTKINEDNDFFNELNAMEDCGENDYYLEPNGAINAFNIQNKRYCVNLIEINDKGYIGEEIEESCYVLTICDTEEKRIISDTFYKCICDFDEMYK